MKIKIRVSLIVVLLVSIIVGITSMDHEMVSRTLNEKEQQTIKIGHFAIKEMNKIMPPQHPLTFLRVVSASFQYSEMSEEEVVESGFYVLIIEYEVDGYEEQKKVSIKQFANGSLQFFSWDGGCGS
eukprot:TRINITY_DN291_c0_g9_i1.p1 TRINITY_DN291_c0_g9~~TRINITY_DN291_c0_g9_i1.p1  ORF type:complete len:126 (+),score=42.50 TRINITY_DN291_c0_g9_i1:90-467(+)